MAEQVLKSASKLVDKHGMRALDAIQLASALQVRKKAAGLIFVGSDQFLLEAAKSEGFKIWNPETA